MKVDFLMWKQCTSVASIRLVQEIKKFENFFIPYLTEEQAITKWENDNGIPDIDNLIALSKIMGITLDELVMGEKEEDALLLKKEVVQINYQFSE